MMAEECAVIGGGRSAQVEAIEIVFDPSIISYRTVLEFFFHIPDPTNVIRQENDRRTSNRPAVIFYTNDTQKQIAWEIITDVEASGLWYGQKVTQVSPAGSFLDTAPEYHHYLDIFRKATPACAGQTHLRCHCY